MCPEPNGTCGGHVMTESEAGIVAGTATRSVYLYFKNRMVELRHSIIELHANNEREPVLNA
jgi:hypothetical protein